MNLVLAIVVVGLTVMSCKKEGSSNMTVKMTDAPGDFENVFIDIQEVQVHYSDDSNPNGWVTLNTNAGVYDLLTLQNGISTVLAPGTGIPSGKISQIRLILNSQNSVVIDGISFPLKVNSATQSGLKINVDAFLEPGSDYEVLVDFDAGKSIVTEGNGTFTLKPTIKVLSVVEL